MPKLLKPDQISMLRTDGYVAPIPVFSKKEAAGFRRSLEAFEQSMTDGSREETMATLSKFKPHLLFTWLDKICHNETLLNAIEDLIGPDLLIYSSAFFIKNSNDQAYVPWHQDSIYADFKGGKQVRAWVAFTDSNTTNGCMRVIKGSHKKQFKHIDDPSDANNILFRKEKISENVDEELAADLILNPGEMSVHDYGVIHGSEPNFSNDRRIGFAIAFVTPDTIATGRHETAMLARGYASKKPVAISKCVDISVHCSKYLRAVQPEMLLSTIKSSPPEDCIFNHLKVNHVVKNNLAYAHLLFNF